MLSKRIIDILNKYSMNMGSDESSNTRNIRDDAFMSYYWIRDSKPEYALSFIRNNAEKLCSDDVSLKDVAFWLWIVGEYLVLNISKDEDLLGLSSHIDFVVKYLQQNWLKPCPDWLDISNEGIYLSNIAVVYGAVHAINHTLKSEEIQQFMNSIRDVMFRKFLQGGRVASKLGEKEVLGDIGMIAVPFGLLDAGNQILVESIHSVENMLVAKGVRYSNGDLYFGGCERADLTCLLSWYYSERGEVAKAKRLLEQVESLWERDGIFWEVDCSSRREEIYYQYWLGKNHGQMKESHLSYILYAIARQNIDLKEYNSNGVNKGVEILHKPTGDSNPYTVLNCERIPRYPETEQNVFLRMMTQPCHSGQKAYIEYRFGGITEKRVPMHIAVSSEGEQYWQGELGSFAGTEEVKYRFVVEEDTARYISEQYGFTIRSWRPLGDILYYSVEKDRIELFFEPVSNAEKEVPCLSISKYNEDTLKWTFSIKEYSGMNEPIDNPDSDFLDISRGEYLLRLDLRDLEMSLFNSERQKVFSTYQKHGEKFIELLTDDMGNVFKIRCKLVKEPGERYFGMGERYSRFEYGGLDIDNYVYNQYRNQGLKTYLPVPFAISSKGYGVYADTSCYSVFRFGTRLSDLFEIELDIIQARMEMDFYWFIGAPKEIIQSYSSITGKPILPPKWAFGPWMSSNNWDNQGEIYKQVAFTRDYQIPSTVLVIEQWSDEATFYIFNDAGYCMKDGNDYLRYEDFTFPEWGRWPDPKKMADDLHQEGIKILLWQAPVQKFMDGIAHEQRDEDERVMLENGYHVKHKNGEPYRIPNHEWFKRSLVPDFTNPQAREWWLNKRRYLVEDIGIDGFKTDGGECIYGEDLYFYDGRSGKEMRNLYPNEFIRCYHEFVQQQVQNGGITFSRAGYTGAQRIPVHWAGDERSTFEAFRSSVRAGLSCGMSGIPFWGWDMAGFNGPIPTAELFIRSAQMAAFCPIMQYHAETKGEFCQDRTPWNIAERTGNCDVLGIYKKYADLRMNLLPYIFDQAIKSSETGIPMMRAMVVEYPCDESCIGLYEQYFFGESLLVAPVMEEGSSVKNVYFPEGKWLDLFGDEEITGSKYRCVKAGIGQIPVFIKENSVIPLNLSEEYRICSHVGNRVEAYNNLCFMIYVTSASEFYFSDDLGTKIQMKIVNKQNEFCINLVSNYIQPITFILRRICDGKVIRINNEEIKDRKRIDANLVFTHW
ncbi:MAG: hypothetical protein N2484_13185 [Clostridia bacterium]|nr:hypothetical protein [Clostridia bacterium]